jgi:MFS family permease
MTEQPTKNGGMFRSLKSFNARLFFAGLLLSSIGSWLQLTATSFLLYRLTGSAVALGINAALQFLPMLLFGAWAGALSDRYNRQRTTTITQSLLAMQAITRELSTYRLSLCSPGHLVLSVRLTTLHDADS